MQPAIVHFEHACCKTEDYLEFLGKVRLLGYEIVSSGPDTTLFRPQTRS